jgi:hypothetical protein
MKDNPTLVLTLPTPNMMKKFITFDNIGNPGIVFKISISFLLKNVGFFSMTAVEGSHF